MNYKTLEGNIYPVYTKISHYQSPLITWIPLLIGENRVRFFALSNLREVKSPFETGLLYTCAEPPITYTCEPPPLTLLQLDYMDALTEILNSRNPARQASRDLYTKALYDAISDELEAA